MIVQNNIIKLGGLELKGEYKGPFEACSAAKMLVELEDEVPDLGILKLIKLVYITHGWLLGFAGKKLFEEPVEVWRRGPVVRSLHDAVKSASRYPYLPDRKKLRELLAKYPDIDQNCDEYKCIQHVAGLYGKFDANTLVDKTHSFGSPWQKAVARGEGIIDNDSIASYYRAGLERISEKQV